MEDLYIRFKRRYPKYSGTLKGFAFSCNYALLSFQELEKRSFTPPIWDEWIFTHWRHMSVDFDLPADQLPYFHWRQTFEGKHHMMAFLQEYWWSEDAPKLKAAWNTSSSALDTIHDGLDAIGKDEKSIYEYIAFCNDAYMKASLKRTEQILSADRVEAALEGESFVEEFHERMAVMAEKQKELEHPKS